MNAGQYEGLMGMLGQIRDRMPEPGYDPGPTVLNRRGWPVPVPVETESAAHQERRVALDQLLVVLDSWIEGAKENHQAMGHRNENTGEECWTQFEPDDFRRMINDAARDIGLIDPVWKGEN